MQLKVGRALRGVAGLWGHPGLQKDDYLYECFFVLSKMKKKRSQGIAAVTDEAIGGETLCRRFVQAFTAQHLDLLCIERAASMSAAYPLL